MRVPTIEPRPPVLPSSAPSALSPTPRRPSRTPGLDPQAHPPFAGLFEHTEGGSARISALAAAEVSREKGLEVSQLSANPAEVHEAESTATFRMIHALHLLADAIDSPIGFLAPTSETDADLVSLMPPEAEL